MNYFISFVVRGVESDPLTITVLPIIIYDAAALKASQKGKLKGMIMWIKPRGSKTV